MKDERREKVNAVKHSLIFLLILCLMVVPMFYLFRPFDVNRKNVAGYYAEKKNSLDAVFVGSSNTLAFWSPLDAWNQFGFTSYDLATNGMPPSLLLGLIKEARKTQNPSLVVINLTTMVTHEEDPAYFTKEYIRNTADMMDYSANRNETISYALKKEGFSANDLSMYFDFLMYHARFYSLYDRNAYQFITNRHPNAQKGFYLYETETHQEYEKKDYSEDDTAAELSDYSRSIMEDLISYCLQNTDTQYLFLVSPYVMTSEKDEEYFNAIGRMVTDAGLSFMNGNDCYDQIGLDFSTDFYNTMHVNILGAEKWTSYLGSYIVDHYSIDHQNINDSSWDANYENWTGTREEAIELAKNS